MRKNNISVDLKNIKPDTDKIKVTVHIPENVRDKQRKINQIYDILNPKNIA